MSATRFLPIVLVVAGGALAPDFYESFRPDFVARKSHRGIL